jgi:hypothetical protein
MNNVDPKQLKILIALIIGVVGAVGYQFMGSSGDPAAAGAGAGAKKTAAKAAEPVERFVEVDVNIDTLLEGIKAVNFDYAAERVSRDPLTPLVGLLSEQVSAQAASDAAPGAPGSNRMEIFLKKISGIVWDKYDPRAVIDNEVVGIGHTYPSGVQIFKIEEKRVTFKDVDSLIHRDLEDGVQ